MYAKNIRKSVICYFTSMRILLITSLLLGCFALLEIENGLGHGKLVSYTELHLLPLTWLSFEVIYLFWASKVLSYISAYIQQPRTWLKQKYFWLTFADSEMVWIWTNKDHYIHTKKEQQWKINCSRNIALHACD